MEGRKLIGRFAKKWQLLLSLQALLYGLGAAIMAFFISQQLWVGIIVLVLVLVIALVFLKPWKPSLESSSSFLDSKLQELEYSTGLLLTPPDELTGLARLQEAKVIGTLKPLISKVNPPTNVTKTVLIAAAFALLGYAAHYFGITDYLQQQSNKPPKQEAIIFASNDTIQTDQPAPKLLEQWVTISYPAYTGVPSKRTSNMNIVGLEGSKVSWELIFDTEVAETNLQSMGTTYPMKGAGTSFRKNHNLSASGFYNFNFSDVAGNSYSSDLYSIEVLEDASPSIKIEDLKQFSTFTFDEEKTIVFNTQITDDFGIDSAQIIATVSKGSGESVKFREETLAFDKAVSRGRKSQILPKRINLDALKLEPGDELYFYVEAQDLKQPKPNIARSETFFAKIKDTTSYEFSLEGTLGVDRMPDYFRSQRQLIIDTEQLIKDKPSLSEYDFKFTSNELGYDQKALRVKYGAYMGEENEIALAETGEAGEALEGDHDHNEDEDPLAEYTHDHDGDNEHNLVEEHDHDHEGEEDSEDPLSEFVHDHGDPEMATLFEKSLRAKLLEAMQEMWDAELYLRLYEPQKSLPYQYRALKHIQDIKNAARIYVHRIGFDPPPIKEDSRLSGELDGVENFRKTETIENEDPYSHMRRTIVRLGELVNGDSFAVETDTQLLELAGNELAQLAIEEPGSYLTTLQKLRWIVEGRDRSTDNLKEVQIGLIEALPEAEPEVGKRPMLMDELNALFLKELGGNE